MAGLAGAGEPFLMGICVALCDVDNLPPGAFVFALCVQDECTHFEYFAQTEAR